MNNSFILLEKIKQMYPDEWALLGNPEMNNTKVLGGLVVFHSKNKKEVYRIEKDKIETFSKVSIVFTGIIKQQRRTSILVPANKRKDWSKSFREMAENGDDKLLMPDIFTHEIIPDWTWK